METFWLVASPVRLTVINKKQCQSRTKEEFEKRFTYHNEGKATPLLKLCPSMACMPLLPNLSPSLWYIIPDISFVKYKRNEEKSPPKSQLVVAHLVQGVLKGTNKFLGSFWMITERQVRGVGHPCPISKKPKRQTTD